MAGDPVLVRAEQPPQAGTLAVTTLRHAGREARASSEDNLTGFVTSVRTNADFDVGGIGFLSSGCHQCNMLDIYGKQLSTGIFVQLYRSTIDVANVSRSWATGNTTELVGPIDAQDGSVIVHGFRVQVTPVTEITADLEPWIGSDMLDLAALSAGDYILLSGGVLGEVLVADRMSPAASGARIRTRTFELAEPAVIFLRRSIQTDESTVVLDCGYFDDICEVADIAWLFGQTETLPFMLVMEIESVGSELRAKRIEVLSF